MVFVAIGGFIFWNQSRSTDSVQESKDQKEVKTQVLGKETEEVRALFIPYWTNNIEYVLKYATSNINL